MRVSGSKGEVAAPRAKFASFLVGLIAIIALQAMAAADLHESDTWKNVQISGAGCWVTGIVAQPRAPGLFYIRTDVGGCYRWDSAAGKWIPITDFLPVQERYSYGGESIAVDPNRTDTVYIASGMWLKNEFNAGPGCIFKSINRGATWTRLGLSGVYMGANDERRWGGERLAIEPDNSHVLLFGSRTQGLWRSTDGGAHWLQASLPYPAEHDVIGVQSVAFDPNTPRTVYAAVSGNGIFKSTDAGRTWGNISTLITNPGRLVVDSKGTVWVTYGNGVAKFSRSRWIDCTPRGEDSNPYCGLAVNPNDPRNVLVSYGLWGSVKPNAIFETLDGGSTWHDLAAHITTDVPWYKANNPKGIDPFDISNFLFDPNNPKSVWFVSGGGIWHTSDIARPNPKFYHMENGHEELCVTSIAAPPSGHELVAGVMDVDGFAFDRGVDRYPSRFFVDADSWASATASIAYEENQPRNLVRLCVQGTLWNKPAIVATSSDGGSNWSHDASFPALSPFGDHQPLAPISVVMSATDPGGFLVCVVDSGTGKSVFYCKKGATSAWTICAGLPSEPSLLLGMNPIAADPISGDTYYAYVNGSAFRSIDGGLNFEQMSTVSIGATGQASFFKLVAKPGVTGDLWLSEDEDNPNYLSGSRQSWEGLYHSSDGGKTWAKLNDITRAMTFAFGVPSSSGVQTLYIHGRQNSDSEDRILRSTDLGKTFTDIQNPAQPIGDGPWVMEGSRQTFGRVFIGTGGRGIFYNVAETGHEALAQSASIGKIRRSKVQ